MCVCVCECVCGRVGLGVSEIHYLLTVVVEVYWITYSRSVS